MCDRFGRSREKTGTTSRGCPAPRLERGESGLGGGGGHEHTRIGPVTVDGRCDGWPHRTRERLYARLADGGVTFGAPMRASSRSAAGGRRGQSVSPPCGGGSWCPVLTKQARRVVKTPTGRFSHHPRPRGRRPSGCKAQLGLIEQDLQMTTSDGRAARRTAATRMDVSNVTRRQPCSTARARR